MFEINVKFKCAINLRVVQCGLLRV